MPILIKVLYPINRAVERKHASACSCAARRRGGARDLQRIGMLFLQRRNVRIYRPVRGVQLQRQHLWMLVGCNHHNHNHLLAARNGADPGTNPKSDSDLQRHGVLELQRCVLWVYSSVRGMFPRRQHLRVPGHHDNVNDHVLTTSDGANDGARRVRHADHGTNP